jgi:hypothetical protein
MKQDRHFSAYVNRVKAGLEWKADMNCISSYLFLLEMHDYSFSFSLVLLLAEFHIYHISCINAIHLSTFGWVGVSVLRASVAYMYPSTHSSDCSATCLKI